MSGQITRRLKPEEEELFRKREELSAILVALAERELDLVDYRSQLATFEGRCFRQVGSLCAELDEWQARLSALKAKLSPSPEANAKAQQTREQAQHTYEDFHGEAAKAPEFSPVARS